MTIQQILQFLENELSPYKRGKVQFLKEGNVETIKVFIYKKETDSYSYIFQFSSTDEKEFKSSIKSGYSGMDYKLGFPLNIELFNTIKDTILHIDAAYMEDLRKEIEAIVTPTEATETPITETKKEDE